MLELEPRFTAGAARERCHCGAPTRGATSRRCIRHLRLDLVLYARPELTTARVRPVERSTHPTPTLTPIAA